MIRPLETKLTALKYIIALVCMFLALRVAKAETLIKILPPSGKHAAPDKFAKRIATGLMLAHRRAPFATCLPQAMLARLLLGRRGYHAAIHIGVKMEHGEMAAHAWTISGETIVSGGPKDAVSQFKQIKILD